jgi:competence protein ComEC
VVALILAFVTGIGLLQVQAELPEPVGVLFLALPALLRAWINSRATAACAVRWVASCTLALGIGFFWAALLAGVRLADELPSAWEGQDIRVVGVVARLPQPFERGVRFEFDVEDVAPRDARVPSRIALTWYGSWRRDLQQGTLPEVHAGERWAFSVRLRRPHGTANPHGFDYEAWLLERGIRATGYVRTGDTQHRAGAFVPRMSYGIERLRESIRDRILDALDAEPYAGVIAALVMGDQRAIQKAQWTVFTRTGVNHLMSISGLHITMISALVFIIAYAGWRRSAHLSLQLPARRAAVVAGFAAALAYAAIAGFGVPTQRTVYMLAVMAVAVWVGQITSAASVLALALLVVTALDPWAVMAPGFWLSFGAVGLILYGGVGPLRAPHWTRAWLQTQWAVTLGLIPLLLAMFQQVSIVSPIANAIAIPVVSLAIVPIALVGTVLPFDLGLQAAHALMALTMHLLDWLAGLPDSVWQQHAPPPWTVAAAFAGIGWMLLPRGFPGRWIGAVAMLPLFVVVPPGPNPGAVHIAVLDVGQGLAVVVRTARHALLYDAGPLYSADADSGSRIVVPYLRAVGIRRLEGLIVSHADNDHAGGAASVLDGVPVGWLASSLPASSPLHAAVGTSLPCYAGQHWQWDGVSFEVLHPAQDSYTVERMKANDRSCVLRISAGGTRVLLTGDAEARSEREMLAHDPEALRAETLVVPHHGSVTSSTLPFVAAVHPQIAIFTVGYRNRFGHPRREVVQRYTELGSRILRSDRHGALLLDIDAHGTHIRAQREERRRYWQATPTASGVDVDER